MPKMEHYLQTSSQFINYQWYNSSGPIFGANTFNFTPSTNDIYWVEVNDSSGCLGASLEYNFILSEIEFLTVEYDKWKKSNDLSVNYIICSLKN